MVWHSSVGGLGVEIFAFKVWYNSVKVLWFDNLWQLLEFPEGVQEVKMNLKVVSFDM